MPLRAARLPVPADTYTSLHLCLLHPLPTEQVRAMHYDWYGIFQGGMIPLTPDSEDETYNCIRQLYVCACVC